MARTMRPKTKRSTKRVRPLRAGAPREGLVISYTLRAGKPKKQIIIVHPYDHQDGDLYCTYRVVQTRHDPAETKKAKGKFNPDPDEIVYPGDGDVCLLCRPQKKGPCPPEITISPVRGVEIDLEIKPQNHCTHCFSDYRFKPGLKKKGG